MRANRLPTSKINRYELVIDDYSGGSNTVISEARLGKKKSNNKYAVEATNLQQCQDGIWETRSGTGNFGVAISGASSLDGGIEYIDSDDTRHILIIGGGKLWDSTDDGATWSEISGATFASGYRPYFLQIKNQMWISNANDALAYFDGTNLNTFSAIADPVSAPTLSRGSGLTTGTYTYYVRYTANNDVGYTNPSPALTVTADKPREQWDIASSEYIDYTIPGAISDADSYDWWLGDVSGQEYHLGSSTELTFRDQGDSVNPYSETPDDNTTAAPTFGPMEMSGNRLWATKDPTNKWRVYGTGTGQYLGYFSPFYGGFWIDIEKGGRYKPISVVHYRTGKGDPIITVLCSSPDGLGTIFQVELSSLSVGDVTFTVPIAYKLVGSIGADAPASVTKFMDNVGFLNKKGVFFLRNKEQMFNVLATDDMTAPIRNQFQSLNESYIANACGYYSPPRLIFSATTGTVNDKTFIFDLEHRNWAWAWNIGFKQFFEYTDSNDNTHLLGIPTSGNRLVEISENYLSDLGQPYLAQYLSPLIPVNPDDPREQAKIQEVIFEIGNLLGDVDVAILGKTKSGDVTVAATDTVASTMSSTGWGDNAFSDLVFSDTANAPTTFAQSSRRKRLRVNKKFYATQYRVKSNSTDTYWQLLSIQANGFRLPGRSPSNWS